MLSVIVLTKNEQARIKACLESVKWADEIIVFDNGSSDKTMEVVKQYTSKIFEFKNQDYAEFRNEAFKRASGHWVLYVDADERVLTDLKDEIKELIKSDEYSAYAISRKNVILGQLVKYGPFWPDWVIRLLKKEDFEGWVGKIHEYPKFKGKLGYTKSSLIHLTHRDLDQIVLKSLEWSKIDASLRLVAKHPKMSEWRFLRILISELFYQGIVRRGFFNGSVGVIDSILQSFSLFMTYVRLWQMQQSKSLNKIYEDIDRKLIEENFKF